MIKLELDQAEMKVLYEATAHYAEICVNQPLPEEDQPIFNNILKKMESLVDPTSSPMDNIKFLEDDRMQKPIKTLEESMLI